MRRSVVVVSGRQNSAVGGDQRRGDPRRARRHACGEMKVALKTNKFAPWVLREGVSRAPSGCDQTAAHHNGRWLRSASGASGACDADCASSPAKAPSWLGLRAQGPPYDGERQCPARSGR